MRHRESFFRGVGIAASILLFVMVLVLYGLSRRQEMDAVSRQVSGVSFQFEPEVLVYDGTERFDLLQGVTASEDGAVYDGEIHAVLVPSDLGGQRFVRYTAFDREGRVATQVRRLQLEGYKGPVLTVSPSLELKAEELSNLISVLADKGELKADDGFGHEISSQVSWMMEKLERNRWQMTFSLQNSFYDSAECTAVALIEGEVDELVLELAYDSIEIWSDAEWNPRSAIVKAEDSQWGNMQEQVQIEGDYIPGVPGTYQLRYTLLSVDQHQKIIRELQVEVKDGPK